MMDTLELVQCIVEPKGQTFGLPLLSSQLLYTTPSLLPFSGVMSQTVHFPTSFISDK